MDLNSSTWRKPPMGVLKVNVRSIYSPAPNVDSCLAGMGIVIRDHNGSWLSGIAGTIRRCRSKKTADLFAIYAGLRFAWDNGVRHIWLETESELAFYELYEQDPESRLAVLVNDIIKLMFLEWKCRIYLVSRTSNDVATLMALDGITNREGLFQFDEPLPELIPFLETESLNPHVEIDGVDDDDDDDDDVPLLIHLEEDGERISEDNEAQVDEEETTIHSANSEEIQLENEEVKSACGKGTEMMKENEPEQKKLKTVAGSVSIMSV